MTTISTLPPAPARTDDQQTFTTKADALLGSLAEFVADTNTVAAEINANAVSANDSADDATSQAMIAQAAAATSTSSANAAMFNSSTTYQQGQSAISPTDFQTYRRKTTGSSATDPSADSTNWVKINDNLLYQKSSSSISTDQTLTSASVNVLEYTPTVVNLSIIMPSALSLDLGINRRCIINKGIYELAIRDNAGDLLCAVAPNGFAALTLTDKTTAAGEWRVLGQGVKYVAAIKDLVGLSSVFTPVGGALGIIKMSETVAVFVGMSSATVTLQAYDFSTLTLGASQSIGVSTTFQDVYSAAVSATNGVILVGDTGATIYGFAFTLSGTSITLGTLQTRTIPSGQVGYSPNNARYMFAQVSAGTFVGLFRTTNTTPWNVGAITATVSGTSLTINSAVNMTLGAFSSQPTAHGSYKIANNEAIHIIDNGAGWVVYQDVITGSTPAQTTAYALGVLSGYHVLSAVQMASDEWWFLAGNTGGTIAPVRVKRLSSASLSINVGSAISTPSNLYGNAYSQGYHPDSAGIFTKYDATSCVYTDLSSPNVCIKKVVWNSGSSTFSVTGLFVPNPTQFPNLNRYPYVAGNNAGYFASVGPTQNGLQGGTGLLSIFSIDSKLGVNSSGVVSTIPLSFVFEDLSNPSRQEYEIVYRNNKLNLFIPFHSGVAGAVGNANDVYTVDLKTGELLSRTRLIRDSAFATPPSRNVMTFKNGAYAVIAAGSYLTVAEMAK